MGVLVTNASPVAAKKDTALAVNIAVYKLYITNKTKRISCKSGHVVYMGSKAFKRRLVYSV